MKRLLKGGRVVDPATGRDGMFDVLIDGGRIARVLVGELAMEVSEDVGGQVAVRLDDLGGGDECGERRHQRRRELDVECEQRLPVRAGCGDAE